MAFLFVWPEPYRGLVGGRDAQFGVPKPGTPNPRATQHFRPKQFGVPKNWDTEYHDIADRGGARDRSHSSTEASAWVARFGFSQRRFGATW